MSQDEDEDVFTEESKVFLPRQGAVAAEEAGGRVGRPRPRGGEQGAADQGQRRGRGGGRQQQDLQGALSGGRGEENSAGNDDYNTYKYL